MDAEPLAFFSASSRHASRFRASTSAARTLLEISATDDDLHTLERALSNLRDLTAQMRITLSVKADSEGKIDRVKFQNLVREPLEEDDDVDFKGIVELINQTS